MAKKLELISEVTVGSGGAASIDFTSIPSTYSDLYVRASVRCGRATTHTSLTMRINNDTGSNYATRFLAGATSTVDMYSNTTSTSIGVGYMGGTSITSNTFADVTLYIPNYTTSPGKSMYFEYISPNNSTDAHVGIMSGRWTGTTAITSLSFYDGGGGTNLLQYSKISLYGIKNS